MQYQGPPRRNFKVEERNDILIRSHISVSDSSDISEDVMEESKRKKKFSFTDLMDSAPNKLMKMEINLASERR